MYAHVAMETLSGGVHTSQHMLRHGYWVSERSEKDHTQGRKDIKTLKEGRKRATEEENGPSRVL